MQGTLLNSVLVFLLYLQVGPYFFFYLLSVFLYFLFFIYTLQPPFPKMQKAGKTVTGRTVLSITEFEVIFHCAHTALVFLTEEQMPSESAAGYQV